tara:strand:+ start:8765 stop:10714 length:1950 start_codon:yes stop_codon:yes gene_type:complete
MKYNNYKWYLNRFKSMSFKEYFYRFNQKINNIYNKSFHSGLYPQNVPYTFENINLDNINHEKRSAFTKNINIFGKSLDFSMNSDWHKDIFNNKTFPNKYGKDINIRSDELGNAKFVWEINRLQFLPSILFEYISTDDKKYLNLFMEILESWKTSNPYLIGINWHSNIEVNLRLISWFWCWSILDIKKEMKSNNVFKEFVDKTWIPLIYMHCKYSYNNPSKFSSANNHLISEYAGLFVATSLWKFDKSDQWNLYAKQGLEIEIDSQHSKNGINLEEASKYIPFITDFLLLCWLVGVKTSNKFSKSFIVKLESIFDYIYHLTDIKCNDPSYGDQDDGFCYLLDNDNNINNFKSLLISGAILFKNSNYKTKAGPIDFKNLLLFGVKGEKIYSELELVPSSSKSKFYDQEGHFISKTIVNKKEIYLHFNASNLGYLSIAAHGHADALSFVLNINGNPIIVESGTFTYHSNPDFRKYFIGTLSHNTLRIDNCNQAQISGPTMWSHHYQTSILDSYITDNLDFISATHDGYRKNNVKHFRDFYFDKNKLEILIIDRITILDQQQHFIDLPFHLHPKVEIGELSNNRVSVGFNKDISLDFTLEGSLDSNIVIGSTNPILGWYSPKFNKKVKSPVIYCSKMISESVNIQTKIKINLV